MFDPDIQRKAISLIMGFIMEFSGVSSEPEPIELTADNLNVSTVSVSCLKVSWDSEPNRDYSVSCTSHDDNNAYGDNMYFAFKGNDLCYITGLRENTEYTVTVEPILSEEEKDGYSVTPSTADGKTETVKVIYDFPYEDGWTNCFAGERASGLTAMPSSGAIYGSKVDTITETGIRRDEYGDYCCAMGVWYGYCGDRFLIELENGTQFTTKYATARVMPMMVRVNITTSAAAESVSLSLSMTIITYRPAWHSQAHGVFTTGTVLSSELISNQSKKSTTVNP